MGIKLDNAIKLDRKTAGWSAPQAGHIGALGDPALRRRLVEFLSRR
jgi:hypothetical protein